MNMLFGEDIGCEDLDIPLYERRVMVLGVPIGVLGGVRVCFKGKLKEFLNFDFLASKPKKLPNPPKKLEQEKGNWFIWGVEDFVEKVINNLWGK